MKCVIWSSHKLFLATETDFREGAFLTWCAYLLAGICSHRPRLSSLARVYCWRRRQLVNITQFGNMKASVLQNVFSRFSARIPSLELLIKKPLKHLDQSPVFLILYFFFFLFSFKFLCGIMLVCVSERL